MKIVASSRHAAVGLTAMLAAMIPAHVSAITAAQQIASFEPEDFAYTIGGPEPNGTTTNGVQIAAATIYQMPSLEGQGVAMVVVNFEPCSINVPHIHPRATEMLYVIKGDLRVAFVEENGGTRGAIVNDLTAGDATFFPKGLIHYQQNLGCEEAAYVAAVNSEDPGVVEIATKFFDLPDEAIEGATNLDLENDLVMAFVLGLPTAPAAAREECLLRCASLANDDDDSGTSYSYSFEDFVGRKLRGAV